MHEEIHSKILKKRKELEKWFEKQSENLFFPIYSSVDIRDAGIKLASVDANIFPAGFNNICEVDQEGAGRLFENYLTKTYGTAKKKLMLFAESETTNKFYWDNVRVIQDLLKRAGAEVVVGVPKDFKGVFKVKATSGLEVELYSAKRDGSRMVTSEGFVPDVVISNNDFSTPYSEWFDGLQTPVNPPHDLGWYRRKKSEHFTHYNKLAEEFAKIIGVDSWVFTVETEVHSVDFSNPESVDDLARHVDRFVEKMSKSYSDQGRGCSEPIVFIKNNRGTYGMGILTAKSGQEVREMNQKARKKMGYSKGGVDVTDVIIQEGIPTQVKSDGDTAEPAIYLIGNHLAGGFLRTHKEKGSVDNLNAPGAVFKKLCMSDLIVDVEGSRLENIYGWVARLNSLAIGREAKVLGF